MKNKKTYWFLVASTTLLSWVSWGLLYRSLYLQSTDYASYWTYPIISFFSALTFLTIFVMVEQSRKVLVAVVLLATFPTVVLAKFFGLIMIPVWAGANLLMLMGINRMRKEQLLRTKFRPHALIRFGIPYISTALAVLIAANYFFAIQDRNVIGQAPHFNVAIPQNVVNAILNVSARLFQGEVMESISSGVTVDEFIQQSARNTSRGSFLEELEGSLDQPQDRQLTDDEKNELRKRLSMLKASSIARDEARSDLSKQLGVPLKGNDQMRAVIGQVVNQKVDTFFNQNTGNPVEVPATVSIALFLTVKAIIWVLSYLLFWTVAIFFTIMVKMGAITLERVKMDVEQIG